MVLFALLRMVLFALFRVGVAAMDWAEKISV